MKRPRRKLPGARVLLRPEDLRRQDADGADFPGALDRKLDVTVLECEQGVILAHADVITGVELGAALTDDDRTCRDQLAAERFDAQAF